VRQWHHKLRSLTAVEQTLRKFFLFSASLLVLPVLVQYFALSALEALTGSTLVSDPLQRPYASAALSLSSCMAVRRRRLTGGPRCSLLTTGAAGGRLRCLSHARAAAPARSSSEEGRLTGLAVERTVTRRQN